MRTLIISYDLAQPHRNKHILAHHIMAIGNSWARPLEQTWYVRTDASEEEIEAQLRGALDPDDGLLIQATRTRRFSPTRRCAGSASGAPASSRTATRTSSPSRCRSPSPMTSRSCH
jgi:hypothetical protein